MTFSDKRIEALSIDCVIFGFKKGELNVLLVKHKKGLSKGNWGLPGSWIQYNESIDEAASRILVSQTSVGDIYLEQIYTFGKVKRFPSKRVITVAYFALVKIDKFNLNPGPDILDVSWFNVSSIPKLIFDHTQIFNKCFDFLRHKIQHESIGFNLLPPKFTLLQLQELYEAVLQQKLDKSNFRRKLLKMNLLIDTNEKQEKVSHRAAKLYCFNEKLYSDLKEKGFIFKV